MATVPAAKVSGPLYGGRMKVVKWAAVAAADTITPYVVDGHYSDVTVYFLGTFGGNMSLTGSPDPAATTGTFVTLKDAESGTAIGTISAAAVRSVLNGALAFQPVAAAGVTAVDVWLVMRASK